MGDGILTGAVQVVDPDQPTVLDLLRMLDYPNEYVPVVAEPDRANVVRPTLAPFAWLNQTPRRGYSALGGSRRRKMVG